MTEALHILGAKLKKSYFAYFAWLELRLGFVRTSSRPDVAKVRSIGEKPKY